MIDDESTQTPDPGIGSADEPAAAQPPETTAAGTATTQKGTAKKTTTRKTAAKKTTAKKATTKKATTKKTAAKKSTANKAATASPAGEDGAEQPGPEVGESADTPAPTAGSATSAPTIAPVFQPPEPVTVTPRKKTTRKAEPEPESRGDEDATPAADQGDSAGEDRGRAEDDDERTEGGQRRRRRRGGRRRRKNDSDEGDEQDTPSAPATTEKAEKPKAENKKSPDDKSTKGAEESGGTRRRRRRRRQGEDDGASQDDPQNTVVRVREPRQVTDDEISGVTGSTRLEAKKQRRREGREAGRRRAPIVSEAEFLARREAVDRVMVVRQRKDVTQIGVLEDNVLVEHYVARESQTSMIGNVYLGRVQNVLPSMEAAFIDIGKGRNAVLYAGEVNWGVLGKEGQPRRIETALKSGQTVLVQVTKDPVGHKGARLTSQVSLPGRYLVYVPGGQTSGISRKLPDTERNRLKNLLKEILPEDAGVIIRTAAEGASEDELRRDVTRLTARWDDIETKVAGGQAPQLLYGEPDLMIKVVRDLFTEDFAKLVVSGDDAWDMIEGYVSHVAPDLMDRVERWPGDADEDVFSSYRVDDQIAKGLERKVWLPSGGSLIIDRTEAMTVVDVNTGKFTGSGGNLEETVTKNNLEAAEEIVRQLRVRDIGGIIVVDFIDMVLESNRDLVLRRLIECLGRDRTRHQVAEVTSLGLVQMTRKRIGTGLLEAFSEPCESCGGRGLHTHLEPVEPKKTKADSDDSRRGGRRDRRGGDSNAGKGKKQDTKQDTKQDAKRGKTKAPEPATAEPETVEEPAAKEPDTPAPEAAPPAETEAAPAETEAAPAEPAAAEPPQPTERPVRRSRRRAATRPAGPPQRADVR